MSLPALISFGLYLVVVLIIGTLAWRATSNLKDYVLGGRRLGPTVAALSAGASDMSGWLLLGLPGAVYLSGLNEAWMVLGLVVGAWCNWRFVAPRLRDASAAADDSLTLPRFLANHLQDPGHSLRITTTLVIVLFFTVYTAAGLVAGAKLFETTLGLPYLQALLLGAGVIIAYTTVGGFLAVSWTDLFQGLLMMAALVLVPLVVIFADGSNQVALPAGHLDPFQGLGAISLLSLLAWGLGYMGQPHILARFMALRSSQDALPARRIGISWMVISTVAAVAVGLAGRAWFGPDLATSAGGSEAVFIALTQVLFNPWIAGVLLAAILAAVMSTVDSQLLVASSSLAEDLYRPLLRPNASERELLWAGRGAVAVIATCALILALAPDSGVLALVSYAWAGLGAAIGPVVLLALYWPGLSRQGALAAMVSGAVTVVAWKQLSGGLFDLYELLPGFLMALLAAWLVSRLLPPLAAVAAAGPGASAGPDVPGSAPAHP